MRIRKEQKKVYFFISKNNVQVTNQTKEDSKLLTNSNNDNNLSKKTNLQVLYLKNKMIDFSNKENIDFSISNQAGEGKFQVRIHNLSVLNKFCLKAF